MNHFKVIKQLKSKYPKTNIVENKDKNGKIVEIVCEVEPARNHPDYSIAIAVIDKIIPHYHKKAIEEYEILKGKILLKIDDKEYYLSKGDKITIKPRQVHQASGKETWIKVRSIPGWKPDDHFLERDE